MGSGAEGCQRACGVDGKSAASRQGSSVGWVGIGRSDKLSKPVVTAISEQQRTLDWLGELDAESVVAGRHLIVSSRNHKLRPRKQRL